MKKNILVWAIRRFQCKTYWFKLLTNILKFQFLENMYGCLSVVWYVLYCTALLIGCFLPILNLLWVPHNISYSSNSFFFIIVLDHEFMTSMLVSFGGMNRFSCKVHITYLLLHCASLFCGSAISSITFFFWNYIFWVVQCGIRSLHRLVLEFLCQYLLVWRYQLLNLIFISLYHRLDTCGRCRIRLTMQN